MPQTRNSIYMSKELQETLEKKFLTQTSHEPVAALLDLQKESMEAFTKLGFPTTKHEEWKYTSVASVLKVPYAVGAKSSITAADIAPFMIPDFNANVLVFVNGHYEPVLSTIVSPANQLLISDLQEVLQTNPTKVETYLGKLADNGDAFTALSTAFIKDGAFIEVPDNKLVENPVLLLFIQDARESSPMVQPRNLFVVGRNAQVKIVENYHTLGDKPSFTNVVTEIVVKQDAVVDYYKFQNDSDNANFVGTTQVLQVEKSVFSAVTITLSGGIIRNNLNIVMAAEHCESHMYGLFMVDGDTHVDSHTIADHASPNCESNELYKGVLDGSSTGVFNGKIFVRKDAQKTNAFQSNKNILLSREASINTKPQLEILADDVKCSHGCTIGQLDQDAMFYLKARGIGEETAKAMLTHAFASNVLEYIKDKALSAYLDKLISLKTKV